FAARMSCANVSFGLDPSLASDDYANGLGTWLDCGGCSHAYPATSAKPNISLDFFYVSRRFEHLFRNMNDLQLVKALDFINNGATKGWFYGANYQLTATECNGGSGVLVRGTCWETSENG